MKVVLEDQGQKTGEHEEKNKDFITSDYKVYRVALPVGDYVLANELSADVIKRKHARGLKPKKMDFIGTYKTTVDTKKDIQELIGNVCGKQHPRFRDECIFAKQNNIKLYILIANTEGVKTLDGLDSWHNPRLDLTVKGDTIIGHYSSGKPKYNRKPKYPKATKGSTLKKACLTMQQKYGVTFLFCTPAEQGKLVLEILEKEVSNGRKENVFKNNYRQ